MKLINWTGFTIDKEALRAPRNPHQLRRLLGVRRQARTPWHVPNTSPPTSRKD